MSDLPINNLAIAPSVPAHPREHAHGGERAGGRARAWWMMALSAAGNEEIGRRVARSGLVDEGIVSVRDETWASPAASARAQDPGGAGSGGSMTVKLERDGRAVAIA